jgi:hypothetical protein
MTALYPSTSAAQVFVPLPVRLSTTGGSAPIESESAPIGVLADLGLTISDSAGTPICAALFSALPAGVTVPILGGGVAMVRVASSKFTVEGQYFVAISYIPDTDYTPSLSSFQWGGWIDTMLGLLSSIDGLSTSTAATVDQTVAILSASYDVDDPAAPTVQTLSIGGSPIATRTIANADGSAINPAQVLILGELTAVP